MLSHAKQLCSYSLMLCAYLRKLEFLIDIEQKLILPTYIHNFLDHFPHKVKIQRFPLSGEQKVPLL